jgi:hypothetical protein
MNTPPPLGVTKTYSLVAEVGSYPSPSSGGVTQLKLPAVEEICSLDCTPLGVLKFVAEVFCPMECPPLGVLYMCP